MWKAFCDKCGSVMDDGENGAIWVVRAAYSTRDDGVEMNDVDEESFELCPACYEKMLGGVK